MRAAMDARLDEAHNRRRLQWEETKARFLMPTALPGTSSTEGFEAFRRTCVLVPPMTTSIGAQLH